MTEKNIFHSFETFSIYDDWVQSGYNIHQTAPLNENLKISVYSRNTTFNCISHVNGDLFKIELYVARGYQFDIEVFKTIVEGTPADSHDFSVRCGFSTFTYHFQFFGMNIEMDFEKFVEKCQIRGIF